MAQFEFDTNEEWLRRLDVGLKNASAAAGLVYLRKIRELIKISVLAEYRAEVKADRERKKLEQKRKRRAAQYKKLKKIIKQLFSKPPKPKKAGKKVPGVKKTRKRKPGPKKAPSVKAVKGVRKPKGVKKQPVQKNAQRKSKRKKFKTRSKPGEPPRRDTGTLLKSWNTYQRPDGTVVFADTSAPYATYLERGTPRMLPRPYIRRAFDESKERMEAVAILALQRALR